MMKQDRTQQFETGTLCRSFQENQDQRQFIHAFLEEIKKERKMPFPIGTLHRYCPMSSIPAMLTLTNLSNSRIPKNNGSFPLRFCKWMIYIEKRLVLQLH